MKTKIAVMLILLLAVSSASAGVPSMISYQGKLMQPSGAPVPDGTYSICFAIYDAQVGGNMLWSEINPSVQIKGGLFSVLLGNLTDNIVSSSDRWFSIKVGNDPEMAPRQQIASVVFAFKSANSDVAQSVPDASITTEKVAPGAITADRLAVGVAVPPGTIMMWSGAANNIPQGWTLCNGQNGTPNLMDRFIVGAGNSYGVGATGGSANVTLSWDQMPAHKHGVNDPGHNHGVGISIGWGTAGENGGWGRLDANSGNPNQGWAAWSNVSLTGISTQNAGSGQPHENRPPYYALCFIMKLGY